MYLAHYTKRFIPEFDAECRLSTSHKGFFPYTKLLGVIYLQHKKVGLTMTLKHQGCFARLSLRLALVAV